MALRHLDILERDQLVPRVWELELVLRKELDKLAQGQAAVTDVRVAGLLGGITLADHLKAEQVCDDLIELGYIARPLRGNTVQVSPPFIISNQELTQFVTALGQTITESENR